MTKAIITTTHEIAGCYACDSTDSRWEGKGARKKAANHHDKTGHITWAEIVYSYSYQGTVTK